MRNDIVCPNCGQDWVKPYRIKKTDELFQLCDECDAVWAIGIEPNLKAFWDFRAFMAVRGLSDVEDEVEEVDLT